MAPVHNQRSIPPEMSPAGLQVATFRGQFLTHFLKFELNSLKITGEIQPFPHLTDLKWLFVYFFVA